MSLQQKNMWIAAVAAAAAAGGTVIAAFQYFAPPPAMSGAPAPGVMIVNSPTTASGNAVAVGSNATVSTNITINNSSTAIATTPPSLPPLQSETEERRSQARLSELQAIAGDIRRLKYVTDQDAAWKQLIDKALKYDMPSEALSFIENLRYATDKDDEAKKVFMYSLGSKKFDAARKAIDVVRYSSDKDEMNKQLITRQSQ